MNYKVRLTFKADGVRYQPGDFWEPKGSKFDAAIIRHFVYPTDEEPPKRQTRRKKVSNGTGK